MQKYYGKINLGKEVIFFLLFLCLLMSAGCQNGAKENPQESIGIPGGVLACDGENLCHLNEFVVKNGLSYYSYQTGEWKTLCPDPLCTHENQSGCFMYSKRFVRGVLEDNTLFFPYGSAVWMVTMRWAAMI